MSERVDCDVLVSGAGVVGMTVAALAHDAGARVSLLEPHAIPAAPRGPTGVRTYNLTPAARAVLEAVGAWSHLDLTRIGTFTAMAVWDAGSSGRIGFSLPPAASGAMGYIVEHDALVAALAASLAGRRGVVWHNQAVQSLAAGPPPSVVLADGSRLSARLAVAADGAQSTLRSAAGIAWHSVDYAQTALCCNVATACGHGAVARQRFLATGPIALLPLADARACSVVWTTTPDAAARLAAGPEETCAQAIGEAVEHVLGAVTVTSARATFALERAQAAACVSGRVVLAGDAAHVVHPLAGQGLNLGLMDAAALIECIGAPRDGAGPWPAPTALRRYQRWRRSETLALVMVTDGLNRLFRVQSAPLRALRGLGLDLTARAGPLKHWLIERAMGRAGDLPALARVGPST